MSAAQPGRVDRRKQTRHIRLTSAIHTVRVGATGNELFHQREEERLAEPADRRLWLKIERPTDRVLIIFVKNDPETQRGLEASTTFLHFGNFRGKAIRRWRLAGDRKQHEDIFAFRPGDPDAD